MACLSKLVNNGLRAIVEYFSLRLIGNPLIIDHVWITIIRREVGLSRASGRKAFSLSSVSNHGISRDSKKNGAYCMASIFFLFPDFIFSKFFFLGRTLRP